MPDQKEHWFSFLLTSSFYINDGVFILLIREELESATHLMIHDRLAQLVLLMHVGNSNADQTTDAMLFPPRLLDTYDSCNLPANILFNNEDIYVHFIDKFKCLGSHITPALKSKGLDGSPKALPRGQRC